MSEPKKSESDLKAARATADDADRVARAGVRRGGTAHLRARRCSPGPDALTHRALPGAGVSAREGRNGRGGDRAGRRGQRTRGLRAQRRHPAPLLPRRLRDDGHLAALRRFAPGRTAD